MLTGPLIRHEAMFIFTKYIAKQSLHGPWLFCGRCEWFAMGCQIVEKTVKWVIHRCHEAPRIMTRRKLLLADENIRATTFTNLRAYYVNLQSPCATRLTHPIMICIVDSTLTVATGALLIPSK